MTLKRGFRRLKVSGRFCLGSRDFVTQQKAPSPKLLRKLWAVRRGNIAVIGRQTGNWDSRMRKFRVARYSETKAVRLIRPFSNSPKG